jgi:hypothetical protein
VRGFSEARSDARGEGGMWLQFGESMTFNLGMGKRMTGFISPPPSVQTRLVLSRCSPRLAASARRMTRIVSFRSVSVLQKSVDSRPSASRLASITSVDVFE